MRHENYIRRSHNILNNIQGSLGVHNLCIITNCQKITSKYGSLIDLSSLQSTPIRSTILGFIDSHPKLFPTLKKIIVTKLITN